MGQARAIARWLLYPVFVVGSIAALWFLLRRFEAPLAMNIVNVSAGALLIGAEIALPYRRKWQETIGDVGTDVCYLALTALAVLLATSPILFGLTVGALEATSRVEAAVWPTHWPLWVQVPLALLLYELGSYVLHTLSHRTRLWRLHSVHHSVRRLYWLNSIRAHPIDFMLSVAATSGPLLLLGAGDDVFAYVTVIGTVNMWLQHANVDTRTGWLDWIFVTPRIHRWHHSQKMSEQTRNLGAVLIVWDVVFGTRLAPADREPPEEVGPGHAGYPDSFAAQLAAPFVGRLWRDPSFNP